MRVRVVASVAALSATLAVLVGPGLASADPSPSASVADAQSAPDEATALQIAVAYDHSVLVDSATTPTGQLAALPDGTMKSTESTVPARVWQDESWQPVDLGLQMQPDGMFAPAATPVPVKFSDGGVGPLAQVQSPSGEWLSESWAQGALPIPTVTADSVVYPEVFAGVDLRLTATALGMSEVLVVKTAGALADPGLSSVSFGVDDGSMTTATEPTGGVRLTTDSDGSPQLVSASPTWWDSSGSGASAASPGGNGIPLPLDHSDTATQITVDAASAASTPGVTFPVYVDPPFTGVRVNYTFADSAYPGVAYWNGAGASDSYFHVGYIDAAHAADDHVDHTTRSYWSMAIDGMAGKHIVSAALDTYEEYSSSCTGANVQLWTTTAASSSTTWNNQPTWQTLLDTQPGGHGANSSCAASSVGFDATSAVQAAADAGSTRMNLLLRSASETNWLGWTKFDNNPTLEIIYQTVPTAPADRSVNGCYVQCSEPVLTHRDRPTITAQSDGDPGSFDYTFKVYTGHSASPTSLATSVAVTNVPLGTAASWVVTTSAADQGLFDGDFEYEARACIHATTVCGDWSGWFTFTVDTVAPAAPTASSAVLALYSTPPNPPPTSRYGNQGTPASVTISSAGSTDDYAYVYSPQSSLAVAAIPGCGAAADVITNCSLAADHSLAVSITPAEFTSTLSIKAIDRAGNISATTTYTYYPNGTLANAPLHGWVQTTAAFGASTIADWSGASPALGLSLHGNAQWEGPSASDNGPYFGKTYNEALSFDGTNSSAQTAAADVRLDVNNSATVAVWAQAGTGGGLYQTMLSQDGPYQSSFYLQSANGHWRMCMPESQASSTTYDCTPAMTADTTVTPGTWTLLVGVWDAPARQLTLYVIGANPIYSTTISHTVIAPAATGPVAVGRAFSAGSQTNWFQGNLAEPLIYNAALGVAQIQALHASLPASLGGS